MTSKIDAALALAADGFRVFPLDINAKTPALASDWQQLATTDPARIRSLWTCPVFDVAMDYNVGIALDKDTLVVDVDVRDGKQGAQSLALLDAIHDEMPATRTVTTASGGEHRYFRTSRDSGTFPQTLAPHIDLKGRGGYVVGPGSTIDGRDYSARIAGAAAPLPSWVDTTTPRTAPRPQNAQGMAPLGSTDSPAAVDRAVTWLERSAPEAVEGANGNATTYAVAARVKDFGISSHKCLDLMLDWNDVKAAPPWEPDALAAIVANAYRYGRDAPGIASPEAEFTAEPVFDRSIGIPLQWVEPFDAASLPRRKWVLGHYLARQYLSGLIAPPGAGKTTFLLTVAIAIASGREDIIGFKVHERARVLLWNQEDEQDELKRRLLAIMAAFDLDWPDLTIDGKPGIVIGSGVDRALMFAKRAGPDGKKLVAGADAEAIERFVIDHGIGVAIFDPFVELHPADENNNVEVAAVARIFRRLAVRGQCAVVLAHHSRKPREAEATGYAGNMDMGRGASALNGVARMVATLFTLDKATGKRFGIGEDDCYRYVRFDDAKNNLGLAAGEPWFFKRDGVAIGGANGEEVGVLRPVKMTRVEDSAEVERQCLVEDVLDCAGGFAKMPVSQVARSLAALPMRSGQVARTLERTLTRVFATPVKTDKAVIRLDRNTERLLLFFDYCDVATKA